jgi:predicted nuclease of predicted toxin-antitoxin system
MKVKLDENLPALLTVALGELGHDVHTSNEEGLGGYPDDQIWRAAQREGRFLIRQDLDFSDVRRFVPGTHYGILLIHLHSPSQRSLMNRIRQIFEAGNVHEWGGCFIVATERKVRIRKPG